jgi:hypothetical protein
LKQHENHHKNSDASQSAGTALSILHHKIGTEKKNRELQVPHHELKVLQDRLYDASDVPFKSPSDVPSTSPSDAEPSDVPSKSLSDVPSTIPSDVLTL